MSFEPLFRLFDVKCVSELFSLSEPTIRRLEKSGKLKSRRIGDRVLFSSSDLEEFIKSCADDVNEGGQND